MMKRLIAWALTLALVLSAVPMTIAAEPAAHSHSAAQHDCEHCDASVTWTKWTSTTTLPNTTGHYYLSADVTLSDRTLVAAGQNVVLCLNGYTVTGGYKPGDLAGSKSFSVYDIRGKVTISDCTAYWDEAGVLHAGTIRRGVRTDDTGGGAFWVYKADAELNVYNIILAEHYGAGKSSGYSAGAVYVRENAKVYMKGCYFTKNYAAAEGGGLMARQASTVYLDSCVFEDNTAASGGSAIFLNNATVTLHDCVVTGNNFSGTSQTYRGAVYICSVSDKLILSGATVIDDNFVAMDGSKREQNIYVQRDPTTAIDVGGLTAGAKVSYRTHTGTTATPTHLKAATAPVNWYHGYVVYENNGKAVDYVSGSFQFVDYTIHEHCVCGEAGCTDASHQKIEYLPWSDTTKLPTSGNYYLKNDVNLAGETSVTADLNLCLNGKTVKAASGKQHITTPANNTLTITISDCTASGEGSTYQAGTFTGGVDKGNGRGGGAIYIRAGGNLKVYDGIFTGNTSDTGGGAIRLGKNASFYMYNGKISGNSAVNGTTYKSGGAISYLSGCTVQILGGTICDNIGYNGGAIYAEADLTVKNCTISGNTGDFGGAVYMSKNTTATFTDCKIQDNLSKGESSAAIYLNSAKLQMKGCEMTGNQALLSGGSVIYTPTGSTITLDSCTITGNITKGTSTNYRGAVYVSGGSEKLTITGATVIDENYIAVDGNQVERNVYMQRDPAVDVGGLTDGANVGIFTHSGTKSTPTMITAAVAPTGWVRGWVIYDNNGMAVDYTSEKGFFFTLNAEHIHCQCGATECTDATHELVGYKLWTNASSLPTAGNYCLDVDVQLTGETSVTGDLNLCLHGHTVTAAKDKQIITTLNNTDLLITISDCTATYENGVYKAGKLTGGVDKGNGRGGGAIYIRAEGDLKVYDGIFTGNTSDTGGGAIRLGKNATFTFYDGEISGNSAIKGTELRGGGAISALGGSTVEILGGRIENNRGGNGGAIFTEGTLIIRDGLIQGNTGANGAVFLNTGAELILSGGKITGNDGGGVYMPADTGITISGDAYVMANTKNGAANNLQLQANNLVTIGQLTGAAQVGISAENAFRTISNAIATDLSAQFPSDRPAFQVSYKNGALYLGAADGHNHCLCVGTGAAGCDHKSVAFAPWDSTTSLPVSGNWYLTADVVLAEGKAMNTEQLNLCLNGHNIQLDNSKYGRLVYLKGTSCLSLTDCAAKAGTISGAKESAVQFENNKAATPVLNLYNGVFTNNTSIHGGGGAVLLQGSGTFNMYGGKLTGNYIKAEAKFNADGTPMLNSSGVQQVMNSLGGGAVCVYGTNATTNIYGGEISYNSAEACQRLKADGTLGNVGGTGGGIYSESHVNIYGGLITENTAYEGGGVLGATNVVITMYGGTISNNTATTNAGGVASFRGVLKLEGGIITGNTANAGGGIRVQGAKVYLHGTDIVNNRGITYGGGIRLSQDIRNGEMNPNYLELTAGRVSNNVSGTGGGILLEGAYSQFLMTGGEISGNTGSGTGGGAYVSTNTVFNMEGGKISGNTGKTAGALRVYKATANLKGGQITGNKSSSNCAGIYVSYEQATLNLMGTELTGNISNGQAGAVLVEDKATMNFTAGKISGNRAKEGGGAIFVSTNSFLNMSGGEITGNNAKNGGAIYGYRSKQLNLTGGTIAYNNAENGGAGVRLASGNLKLGGVSIYGNKAKQYGGGVYAGGAKVTKNGVTTQYCSNVVMTGGSINHNTSVSAGGGVLLESTNSNWTMYGGSISNNTSEKSNGGGMYVSRNTKLFVYGGRLNNNYSSSTGGAVYHLVSTGVYKNCDISGNNSRNGTITATRKCSVELENVTMTGNNVERYGGAVYTESTATTTVVGSSFTRNTAGIEGGALFGNVGGLLSVTDSTFTENHSEKRGGAIGVYDNAAIYSCVFTGNSAVNGGAIYSGNEEPRIACNGWGDEMSKAGMQVVDCEFTDNLAAERGGAIHAYMSCYLDVLNTTFTGNGAELEGSAIWSSENLNMQDLIITGNKSANNGYAVFLADAEYDGHSYIRGLFKLSGDILITDNEGGDLYLDRTSTLAISSAGLGKNAKFGVTLDSGLLTQRLFGSYDYEGGNLVYTVTYGDRSLTDPEYDPSMVTPAETDDQTQQGKTAASDVLLYVGIGVIGLAAVAGAALVIGKKKKTKI